MSYFKLITRIFYFDNYQSKFNIISLLPLLGSVIGIFVFILTFSIMEGIENDMERKISILIPKNKLYLDKIESNKIKIIENIFNKNDIEYFIFEENKFLFNNNNNFKVFNLIIVDNLDKLIKSKYEKYVDRFENKSLKFITGKNLIDNFSNQIEIISTTDINIFTGTPKFYKLNIDGLIDFDFMDFDNNYAFIKKDYAIQKNIKSKSKNKYFFIDNDINNNVLSLIKEIEDDIVISHWKDEYANLFSSILIEKYLYSLFGLLIILISNFTFIIITSTTLINKLKEVGILEVIGFDTFMINKLILTFSITQNIISIILGILLSKLFFMFNFRYDLFGKIFNSIFFIDSIFIISCENIMLVSIFSFISIILASLYPIFMIKKIDIKDKLNYLN